MSTRPVTIAPLNGPVSHYAALTPAFTIKRAHADGCAAASIIAIQEARDAGRREVMAELGNSIDAFRAGIAALDAEQRLLSDHLRKEIAAFLLNMLVAAAPKLAIANALSEIAGLLDDERPAAPERTIEIYANQKFCDALIAGISIVKDQSAIVVNIDESASDGAIAIKWAGGGLYSDVAGVMGKLSAAIAQEYGIEIEKVTHEDRDNVG